MSEQSSKLPNQTLNISGSVLETVQIGGIAGRDLNLTQVQGGVGAINVFGTVQVDQAPTHGTTTLSKQEYRWRQTLLGKVKQFWIEGVLEKSLHTKVVFELGLEERNNLVQKPLNGVEEFVAEAGQTLPEGTTVSKVFEDIGTGRTLLILGEPGAGKTVTLLKLAQNLITRTENNLSQPLPVVMNLSSWAKQRKPIADWLVQELKNIYGANKALGQTWVEQEQLILLLDGLDEVDAQYRTDCVKALNQFIQTHGLTEIVVCSRIRDYEALSERLKLRSAIYVRPLTTQQINDFLVCTGKPLTALRRAIRQNTELQKMASSPLMLSIVSLAYQDCNVEVIPQAGTAENQRKQLLDTYVARMLMRRGTAQQYTTVQTLHWLTFLGKRLVQTSQTVFLIERIQPSWLETQDQRIWYRLESALISCLGIVIFSAMASGLFGSFSDGLNLGLILGLLFGLIIGFSGNIRTVESFKWSWRKPRNTLLIGSIIYLPLFLIFIMIIINNITHTYSFTSLCVNEMRRGIEVCDVYKNIFALNMVIEISLFVCGLCVVLFSEFRGPDIRNKSNPNQGIWKSGRNALTSMLIGGLTIGLLSGLIVTVVTGAISGLNENLSLELFGGLFTGLISAPILGLLGGGMACIRHFYLRLVLWRKQYIPWNYARFLDHATDRLFLQKVGGGYIFVHRMLLEHFAEMDLEQSHSPTHSSSA